MKALYCLSIAWVAFACAPATRETQAIDSAAVELDTVYLDSAGMSQEELEESSHDEGVAELDTNISTGTLSDDGEYTMTLQGSYVVDPFGFSLDTATIRELLPNAVIKYTETPAGKDDEGEWTAYTYYEIESGKNKLSFYSYTGKHYAVIYTPVLVMKHEVVVGMTKADFIDKMTLTGDDPWKANVFTINDDYGSTSFYFEGDTLEHIYVSYEEGT